MELRVAIEKAKQILDEEQASPTVQYTTTSVPNGLSASESFLATTVRGSALIGLAASRLKRPRAVMQDPSIFSFVSVNHDLLRAIESQLSDTARPQFVQFVRQRLFWGNGCRKGNPHVHPSWDNLVSELPLVVEFLVRNGGKEGLASALGTKDIEIIPGHVMMLMQLEDTIALNYTAFSESEYEHLTSAIASFCSAVQSFMGKFRKPTAGRVVVAGKLHYRGLGDIHLERLRDAIFAVCRGITEQCRKAKYLYLKGFSQFTR
jgi:hypothetical protein